MVVCENCKTEFKNSNQKVCEICGYAKEKIMQQNGRDIIDHFQKKILPMKWKNRPFCTNCGKRRITSKRQCSRCGYWNEVIEKK